MNDVTEDQVTAWKVRLIYLLETSDSWVGPGRGMTWTEAAKRKSMRDLLEAVRKKYYEKYPE
jgi:hypothetical protein